MSPTSMFDPALLARVVEAQRISYRMLKWVDAGIGKGLFRPGGVIHSGATSADETVGWLEQHYLNLPADARPESRRQEDLRFFSNLLASYLETSFEFDSNPGARGIPGDCGCTCPMCRRVVAGSNFRPRKVTSRDKKRARKLEEESVKQLALLRGRSMSDAEVAALCDRADLRECTAMVAYGRELVRRAEGHFEGPAVLALWRRFAWKPEGSPKPGFQLEAHAILEAEVRLAREI